MIPQFVPKLAFHPPTLPLDHRFKFEFECQNSTEFSLVYQGQFIGISTISQFRILSLVGAKVGAPCRAAGPGDLAADPNLGPDL